MDLVEPDAVGQAAGGENLKAVAGLDGAVVRDHEVEHAAQLRRAADGERVAHAAGGQFDGQRAAPA